MSHSLSPDVLRVPFKITFAPLVTVSFILSKCTVQPSSQSCPNDIRLECKFGKMVTFFPCADKLGIGRLPQNVDCMVLLLGNNTEVGLISSFTFVNTSLSL